MSKFVSGYILIPDNRFTTGMRKISFRVDRKNKNKARKQLKEDYPNGSIHFVRAS